MALEALVGQDVNVEGTKLMTGVLEVAKAEEPTMLTMADVGELLGVDVATVRRYRMADRARYGFPEPDGVLGRTPWWSRATIDAWVAARPGKGAGAGRPKKAAAKVPAKKRARKAAGK